MKLPEIKMNYQMKLASLINNFLIWVFLVAVTMLNAQYRIPTKPSILYPVYDEVGLLSPEQKNHLDQKLIAFERKTSTEIQVIIISETKGEDPNFLATRFGEEWGIGKKGIDNGVVLLVARDDRRISIQQGRAVEPFLTAATAGQIIDYTIKPQFKKGDYYAGLNQGTDFLIKALEGKFQPLKKKNIQKEDRPSWVFIIIFLIVLFFLMSKGGGSNGGTTISRRGRTHWGGGASIFPFPGGGFGGRGSSGGGFGGFGGGGSFGGGGASGGW